MRRWRATNLLELLRNTAVGCIMLMGLLALLWLLGLAG